jgi:fumarate hydratase, class I
MRDKIVGLLSSVATSLPRDVEAALSKAAKRESRTGREVLETVIENVKLARKTKRPICQDTGTPIFHVTVPKMADKDGIRREIIAAVRQATKTVPLRPNAVDPVSGKNSNDNTGLNFPVIHFSEWSKDRVSFDLMLKGAGSENITQLYRLPEPALNAGRDVKGVSRCVLDAVHKAQGRGCPPYVVGVGIGGLADEALKASKMQLFRDIADRNRDMELARLEAAILRDANSLGIGPMGLGGKTTLLAVKVAKQHRHPASYFVAVSFMCWAMRRKSIEVRV